MCEVLSKDALGGIPVFTKDVLLVNSPLIYENLRMFMRVLLLLFVSLSVETSRLTAEFCKFETLSLFIFRLPVFNEMFG